MQHFVEANQSLHLWLMVFVSISKYFPPLMTRPIWGVSEKVWQRIKLGHFRFDLPIELYFNILFRAQLQQL